MDEAQTTLRDTISGLVDKAEAGEPIVETPKVETQVEKQEVKTEVKTDGRPRDEQGRFVPSDKGPEVQKASQQEPQPLPEVKRPPRPSSWKKDYWDHWEKLDPKLAEYINQRESEYAKGVSTYKQEWDRAKPILDVVSSIQPELERYGIKPEQQIQRYFEIHKALALGSPEQKLQTFLRVAQEYQVPVQNLFVRGQDGQIYFNNQLMQQQTQQPQVDVERIIEAKLQERSASQEAQSFASMKDASGNPAHPHFEAVRDTMAQLLEAGLAEDLNQAYEAALRHPRHSDIFEAEQQQRRQQEESERQRKLKEEADRAKRNAVSTRTQTPSSTTNSNSKKGLRSIIEEAVDTHAGGRV